MEALDPITLEVVGEGLISVVREMRATVFQTARSVAIYEARDFSCGLFDATGRVVAQSEDIGSHVVPLPWSVEAALARFQSGLRPGDVILMNDVYHGGTHLNDVTLIYPVFADGELVFIPAVREHWADVGGAVPGSMSGTATEIYQEGMRIPPIKIIEAGQVNQAAMDLILSNMRVPDERLGDFRSGLAARRGTPAGPERGAAEDQRLRQGWRSSPARGGEAVRRNAPFRLSRDAGVGSGAPPWASPAALPFPAPAARRRRRLAATDRTSPILGSSSGIAASSSFSASSRVIASHNSSLASRSSSFAAGASAMSRASCRCADSSVLSMSASSASAARLRAALARMDWSDMSSARHSCRRRSGSDPSAASRRGSRGALSAPVGGQGLFRIGGSNNSVGAK